MRKIYALLLALVATVALQAQSQDNAMYVYRNDGGFNAFLREDIDSITLSHFDLDSIQHNEPVCQVFFTPDSIYRIPIEAIDSVSFVQPETKYASGVVRIDEWIPYLSSVDTTRLAVSFKPSLPFTANKGDVLFYPNMDDERFPIGFAGKIVEIEKGDNIVFVCDSASIDDIFEQLLVVGKIVMSDEESQQSRIKKISAEGGYNKAVSFPLKYSDDHFALDGTVNLATTVHVLLRMQLGMPFYSQISLGANIGIDLHANAKYKSEEIQRPVSDSIGKYISKPFIDVPIPEFPMVRFKVRAAPIFKLKGEVDIDANFHADAGANVDVKYNNGKISCVPTCSATSSWDAKINLDGTIFGGVRLYPYLTCVANIFTVSFKIDAGPKLEGNFVLDAGSGKSTYESLKDSKIALYAGASFQVKPQFKVFNWEMGNNNEENKPFTKSIFPKIHDWYLLPEFTQPKVEKNSDGRSVVASSTPSRDLFMPVKLGMGLVDTDGNLIETKYYSDNYWQEKDWPSNALWGKFDNLASGKSYKVMPYLKILGMEMKASPSKEFNIEGEACVDANHVHKVDLGLSVKWACCNVGASSPEQYGGYYAWGETSEKSSYTDENSLTLYKEMGDIAGTQYDVAHVKWGGSWRMPTRDEIRELVNNCSWQWTTVNGVSGQKVTGPNGNSIFLPAAGNRYGTSLYNAGYDGYYWSSTPYEDSSYYAYGMSFYSGSYFWSSYYWRYNGFSVRPVSE